MPPHFFDAGKPVRHPLEDLFNAEGWDILSAVQSGFRAQVDVKGKLAEWFLCRKLEHLKQSGMITALAWHDKDGVPDFLVTYMEKNFRIECKNIRSPAKPKPPSGKPPRSRAKPKPTPAWRVEIQKTRNQLDNDQETGEQRKPKRGYKADEFEALAVCLFNQTGKWDFLFVQTSKLVRRLNHPEYLEIMQPVPPTALPPWAGTIEEVLQEMVSS